MDYVTAVTHEVTDLEVVREFFCQGLGFTLSGDSTDQLQLSNGSVALCLRRSDNPVTSLCLRLRCDDLDSSAVRLAAYGVAIAGDRFWSDERCQEQPFQAPAGVTLTLYRSYSEDELDIEVALPVNLEWEPRALDVTRLLVKLIPTDFRDSAREKIVAAAEGDTLVEGEMTVSLSQAMQAVIRVTPAFQHDGVRHVMAEQGLDFDGFLP